MQLPKYYPVIKLPNQFYEKALYKLRGFADEEGTEFMAQYFSELFDVPLETVLKLIEVKYT